MRELNFLRSETLFVASDVNAAENKLRARFSLVAEREGVDLSLKLPPGV